VKKDEEDQRHGALRGRAGSTGPTTGALGRHDPGASPFATGERTRAGPANSSGSSLACSTKKRAVGVARGGQGPQEHGRNRDEVRSRSRQGRTIARSAPLPARDGIVRRRGRAIRPWGPAHWGRRRIRDGGKLGARGGAGRVAIDLIDRERLRIVDEPNGARSSGQQFSQCFFNLQQEGGTGRRDGYLRALRGASP